MKNQTNCLKILLPFIIITIIFGTLYSSFCYFLRASANDPQIQYAEDSAIKLNEGIDPLMVNLGAPFDIKQTLGIFTAIYDAEGKPISSNAILNGITPVPSINIFDEVREKGESRMTWEPEKGERFAIVARSFSFENNAGFIVIGKSLREIENRQNSIALIILLGWVLSMAGSIIYNFMGRNKSADKSADEFNESTEAKEPVNLEDL